MKKKIYTVATAHLDTIWNWDFETTVSRFIKNTLVDNFKLFEKYPDYKFSFEGSYRYELMEEYYPDLFEKLKEYVKQGRWNVCGSAFENGDVNIPSPEALFRNILYGNSYFEKTFGKRSCDIYLPDCFGFGWALPSIMHHANLKGFTTQKLTWGSAYGVPFDIGKWKGVDSNEVYASLNPHAYVYTFKKIRTWDFLLNKLKENEKFSLPWTYVFHGVGDQGGAPKEESVAVLEKEIANNENDEIEVVSTAADEIYRDIETILTDEQKAKLPVWNNELVMQNHAVGGYTSRAIGKRWNRRCEELADMAERACVTATCVDGYKYPDETLRRAWKRFIAHQFHDDIPGTSVQRAYRRSWNDYAVSMNQFKNEYENAALSVCEKLKTDFCKGTPVAVHNCDEVRRKDIVKVEFDHFSPYVRVFDKERNEVASQIRQKDDGSAVVTFVADVPAMGYKVYDVVSDEKPCQIKTGLSVSRNRLENEKYIVSLNSNGDICSIIDKTLNSKELLSEPITLGLYNYNGSHHWPAWELNFREINKEEDRIPQFVRAEIVENGCAMVAVKVTQEDGNSSFSNIISLSCGGQTVNVESEIEWENLHTLAKQKFSFTCCNKKATYDLGLGAIERERMSEKLFEVPAQKWADISDQSGEYGVSVISECKYGWDKFDSRTLRLTVLHTPRYNYMIDSMQSMMDLGLNRYSFAICSHSGKVGKQTQRQAKQFIQPMAAFTLSKHDGNLSDEYSFLSLSDDGILLRAIKKAEESDEIVIRVGESENKEHRGVSLKLSNAIESAREIYASEEKKGEAVVKKGQLIFDMKPYEVKSFAVKVKNMPKTKESSSSSMKLPFNTIAVSTNLNPSTSDLSWSLPKEILPDTVSFCSHEFKIAKNGRTALSCCGQTLPLSKETKRVHFLLSTTDKDKNIIFKVGEKEVVAKAYCGFERFAGWDLYDFGETAYIKDANVAYEVTHCHNADGDMYAKQFYFYLLSIDTDNQESIKLPCDSSVLIFASCQDTKERSGKLATRLYDEVEKREFTFSLSKKQKIEYFLSQMPLALSNNRNFISHRNKGRIE